MDFPIYQAKPFSIIYAPWRAAYEQPKVVVNRGEELIKSQNPLSVMKQTKFCVFCQESLTQNEMNNRPKNFLVYAGVHSRILLALSPYIENGYHFLIVPHAHIREASDLDNETWIEINLLTQKLCGLFSESCYEIIVNTNIGEAAGASVPAHQHRHVLVKKFPRAYTLIESMKQSKDCTFVDLESKYIEIQSKMNGFEKIEPPLLSEYNQSQCERPNCYHCNIFGNRNSEENLILFRGKYSVVMISHYPTFGGEIDIMPSNHIEAVELLPKEVFEEINKLTIIVYPLVLNILNLTDSNLGFVTYGKSLVEHDKEHLRFRIIPRRSVSPTPITGSFHVHININNFFNSLKLMLEAVLKKDVLSLSTK